MFPPIMGLNATLKQLHGKLDEIRSSACARRESLSKLGRHVSVAADF